MIPINLLTISKGSPILVELKNGEAYNGHLLNCDSWMNLHLKEVICTSPDGDRFWRMPEIFIRGSTIKYMRIPDEMMDKALEESKKQSTYQSKRGNYETGRGSSYRGGTRGSRPYA